MKKRLFFGRVKSRKLSSSNILLTNKFLKKFIIKKNIFSKKKIVIEIGHGMGENLLNLAYKNKEKIFIGIDPFKNGLANIAKEVFKKKIKNIYIFPYVLEKFFDKYNKIEFNEIYVLFPDPWPKKKHKKRRLVNEILLTNILGKLRKKGKFFFRTDNLEYYNYVIQIIEKLIREKKNYILKKYISKSLVQTKYHKKAHKFLNEIKSLELTKK